MRRKEKEKGRKMGYENPWKGKIKTLPRDITGKGTSELGFEG